LRSEHSEWIKSLLPGSISSLEAHEEAWNAYPYTRTRYSCPLMEKFCVDVETRYLNDAGTTDNVFNLPEKELKDRVIGIDATLISNANRMEVKT